MRRPRRARALAAGCAALLSLEAAASGAGDAECRAAASLAPATAFVGQQVLYRVQIFRHESVSALRWSRALSFPSSRAEWLPGRSPDPRVAGIGEHFLVSEERRALFPALAGDLEIPPARLSCELGGGAELEATVPAARLHVLPLPPAGRPADFGGVVGPVRVAASASAERVELGQAFSLTVSVHGAANVWDAAAPLDPARELPGVDAYPRPPSLALEAGERLHARRAFAWQLVPRRTGTLVVPALRVPWFDPDRARYEVAESAAIEVSVREPAAAPEAAPAGREPPAAAHPPERRRSWLLVAAGLAGAAAAAGILVRHRRASVRPAGLAAGHLQRAEAALARGDGAAAAASMAAALRAALAARLSGAAALAAPEIAARGARDPALVEAAELLAELDRARFAELARAPALPELARLRAIVRGIDARGRGPDAASRKETRT